MNMTKEKLSKILIIEDEGDMCLLLNIMLKEDSTELEHVKSLNGAKTFLETEKADVIILDNKLPDGLGIDFISFLKKNYPAIKIIMISGFDGAVKDLALENGADIFLEKPFSKEQLYNAVHKLL